MRGIRRGRAGERARERRETDEALAERMVWEALAQAGLGTQDLLRAAKSAPWKVALARQLRTQTPMTRRWIADRLHMGSPSYLSALLSTVNSKLRPL